MALFLEINQDESYEFFTAYDRLSPLRKKIWNKISQKCRSWTVVMPSQSKIAEWCGCSRSAISEAFGIFKKHGWIYLESRGWKRSKIICMPHSKQCMDVVNRQWFKRVEATHRATHTYSTKHRSTSRQTGTLDLPIYLQKLKISLDSKLKLSLVPESVYQSALESAKRDAKKGKVFRDSERYVVGTALSMAKKNGLRIDWVKYYQYRK